MTLKKCPQCGRKSLNKGNITRDFGYRNSNGRSIPQSLCRKCRSQHAKAVRHAKAINKNLKDQDLRKGVKSWKSVLDGKSSDMKYNAVESTKITQKKTKTTSRKVEQKTTTKTKKSVWNQLTKDQKKSYRKGHKDYIKEIEKKEKEAKKITKQKRLKKSKQMANFKSDLKTFAKATQNKPKRLKANRR